MKIVLKKGSKCAVNIECGTDGIQLLNKRKSFCLYFEGVIYPLNSSRIFFKNLESCSSPLEAERELMRQDGAFIVAIKNLKNNDIKVFTDSLGKREVFYKNRRDDIYISSKISEIYSPVPKFDHNSLISALNLYLPKGHTLYNDIFRLKYGESINISSDGVLTISSVEEELPEIEEYDEGRLSEYEDIINSSILGMVSNVHNVVELSGGYDSTFILAVLRKHLPAKKVSAATYRMILCDGRVYNPFEVEKCRKIAKYYDIDIDIIDVDLRSEKLIPFWERYIRGHSAENQLYAEILNQTFLAENLKRKYGADINLFNGEVCDSLHNFGYSQFISIEHENYDFREYSDKMKNYLYGPTFFKKILSNKHNDDFIYRLFKWHLGEENFLNVARLPVQTKIFEYLFPFVYSSSRVPFFNVYLGKHVKSDYTRSFKEWTKTNYFSDICKKINAANFYSCLLRIYSNFHLQSPQIRKITEIFPSWRMPFYTRRMYDFMSKAPENWGRGLNFNRVKYPLKRLIQSGKYRYPVDIISGPGHSYLSEITKVNWYEHYLEKSPLSKYISKNVDIKSKALELFDDKVFNISNIVNTVEKYKKRSKSVLPLSADDYKLITFLISIS